MSTRKPSALGLRTGAAMAAHDRLAEAPAAVRQPAEGRPVRFTLDLSRERHRFLRVYALDAGTGAAEVVRALLDELRDDEDLAGRVRARLGR